jgi:hypothetical protein
MNCLERRFLFKVFDWLSDWTWNRFASVFNSGCSRFSGVFMVLFFVYVLVSQACQCNSDVIACVHAIPVSSSGVLYLLFADAVVALHAINPSEAGTFINNNAGEQHTLTTHANHIARTIPIDWITDIVLQQRVETKCHTTKIDRFESLHTSCEQRQHMLQPACPRGAREGDLHEPVHFAPHLHPTANSTKQGPFLCHGPHVGRGAKRHVSKKGHFKRTQTPWKTHLKQGLFLCHGTHVGRDVKRHVSKKRHSKRTQTP